jgi:hypothetical protein
MRSRRPSLSLLTCLALSFAGCATTTFTSSWKAPDAQPLEFKPGDKVVAMVISDSRSLRRSGEANLADELDARGFKAIPGYTILRDGEEKDEAAAKAAIEGAGAIAAVVLRPMGTEKEYTSISPAYYGGPYGSFWGGGYYGYGWGSPWGPSQVRTDTYVTIETLIYDLRRNKLVWGGRTRTMNPSDVESFVKELATAVAKELRSNGLVTGK